MAIDQGSNLDFTFRKINIRIDQSLSSLFRVPSELSDVWILIINIKHRLMIKLIIYA